MQSTPADTDPELVAAFLATDYLVHAEPAFVLRIGHRSTALDALLATAGVDCAAYVTACNPRSTPTSAAENRVAQARLEDELARAGLVPVPGAAVDPTGRWPVEPSLLVPGLDRDTAVALGRRYRQSAILVIRRGAAVELAWVDTPAQGSR